MKIGLTGGIGAGKSIIAKAFNALGIPIYYADYEAKQILNSESVQEELVDIFGENIISEGMVNRKKLSAIVFNSEQHLDKLNALIHPKVRTHFSEWLENNESNSPYVLQEAAILFETGSYKLFDKTILVIADQETRIQRICERDNMRRAEAEARLSKQWMDAKKIPLADYVINNNNDSEVLVQILNIHTELMENK
jgi:dephospho-CoA kinase